MWASGAVGRFSVAADERGVGRDQDRALGLGRQFVFRVGEQWWIVDGLGSYCGVVLRAEAVGKLLFGASCAATTV